MRSTIALAFGIGLVAAGSQAQNVEYVTRNVQPTHAVRFNSTPIRITLTDRGSRTLRVPPVQTPTSGAGRGAIVLRPSATIERSSDRRSRTVYGARSTSEQHRSPPIGRSVRADDSGQAASRRHLLRCLAMLEHSNRHLGRKAGSPGTDDR